MAFRMALVAAGALVLLAAAEPQAQPESFDVAVYGSTPAGVVAAVAAARMGHRVVLLAQTGDVGGMVSGGLSHTDLIRPDDIDNRLLVGGVAREFFELNTQWYGSNSTVWNVEPHVAGALFRRMLGAAGVTVVLNATLDTVARDGARIVSMRDQTGRCFAADVWVEASYEGDLLLPAGVSFAVGREAAAVYNESLAGFTGGGWPQFARCVNPYSTTPSPGGGGGGGAALLPLVDSLPPDHSVGDGDTAVSSYNFRLCVTNLSENRVPYKPPDGYNSADYELVRRERGLGLASATAWDGGGGGRRGGELGMPGLRSDPLPGGRWKYDLNSGGPVGTDFVGTVRGSLPASAWAAANGTTRALMWMQHKRYVQGLLWFLGTDPSIAAADRAVNYKL